MPSVEVFEYDWNNTKISDWWKRKFKAPLDTSKNQIAYIVCVVMAAGGYPLDTSKNQIAYIVCVVMAAGGYPLDTSKNQIAYILQYLSRLKAKTVVVENEYVDHDFLEDFAEYYVKCFNKYERYCSRIHFFDIDFTEIDFNSFVEGNNGKLNSQTLHENYLGFVVIKPLPQTVVGRTCLKTGPRESTSENFPVIRKYKVSFFGKSIEIDSLAFQEQDTVVAACATSALWSAFQATGELFRHSIPSPVEITKLASQLPLINNRSLPNKEGLLIQQMAYAVRKVNLEPFCIGVRDEASLKSNIYAYLRAKIPVVLAICFYEKDQFRGRHAVTIAGFKLETQNPTLSSVDILFTSSCINKIYVHDDGIGPFAEMEFDGKCIPIPQPGNAPPKDTLALTTLWGIDWRACPEWILIPVYHKIRITLQEIKAVIVLFNQILNLSQSKQTPFLLEWEVYLSSVADLKEMIFKSSTIPAKEKREFLLKSLPRFIWCAKAKCSGSDELDLFFDATDIGQGELFLCALEHKKNISSLLKTTQVFNVAISSLPGRHPVLKIIEHLS